MPVVTYDAAATINWPSLNSDSAIGTIPGQQAAPGSVSSLPWQQVI